MQCPHNEFLEPSTTLATKGSLTHHVQHRVIRHFPTKPGITPPPPPSTPHLRHHQGGGGGEGVMVHIQLYPRKRGGLIHPTFSLYISLSLYPHTHPLLQGCDLTPSTFLGGARGGSAHLPISPIVKPHRPPLQFGRRGGGGEGEGEGRGEGEGEGGRRWVG